MSLNRRRARILSEGSQLCDRCLKSVKKFVTCMDCNRNYHPGCARAYARVNAARTCCIDSFGAEIIATRELLIPNTNLYRRRSRALSVADYQLEPDCGPSPDIVVSRALSPPIIMTSHGANKLDVPSPVTNSVPAQPAAAAFLGGTPITVENFSALATDDKLSVIFQQNLTIGSKMDSNYAEVSTRINNIDVSLNKALYELNVLKTNVPVNSTAEIVISGIPECVGLPDDEIVKFLV